MMPRYGYGYGPGPGFGRGGGSAMHPFGFGPGLGLTVLLFVLLAVAAALLIALVIRRKATPAGTAMVAPAAVAPVNPYQQALAAASVRYANGEITREQFEEIKTTLGGSSVSGGGVEAAGAEPGAEQGASTSEPGA